MDLTETIKTSPNQVQKSVRDEPLRGVTSAQAGKIIPLAYAPLLREDRVAGGRVDIALDMMETVEPLLNGVNVTAYAHLVPFLALPQFEGSMDQLNRSYTGQPQVEGGAVKPFFNTMAYDISSDEIAQKMGLHAKDGATINRSVHDAYIAVANFRRKARSAKLAEIAYGTTSLVPAFWKHNGFGHIVPDFDQAMIDGEVELQLAGNLPVKGISMGTGATYNNVGVTRQTGGTNLAGVDRAASNTGGDEIYISEDPDNPGYPAVFAELASQGVRLSLANIELAKKTAAFAALRKKFDGHDDDFLIDLLMAGVRVPDAQLTQPILLDRKSTLIGYNRRYATDSGNLDKSVTTGRTGLSLKLRTPPINTGGIILITLEIVPEQMFERQKDYFLHTTDTDELPEHVRDFLDPEKVSIVKNDHADIEHTTPAATFGYAPLNHQWRERNIPRVGGKYMREVGDPANENRNRIWSVEQADPALTSDFYVVNDLHHNVFADTLADPFEITTRGNLEIVGNTVFGKGLQEDTSDYEEIMADVDTDRIDQDA